MIAIVVGKFSVNAGHKKEQKHLTKLEEFYQAKDYAAIDEYLSDKDLWDSSYEKYDEISRVYTYYAYLENDIMHIREILDSEMTEDEKASQVSMWCESVIEDASSVLEQSAKYSEDMQFLGNEEELERFYHNVVTLLAEFGYTKEEIELIRQVEKDNIQRELLEKLMNYYLK